MEMTTTALLLPPPLQLLLPPPLQLLLSLRLQLPNRAPTTTMTAMVMTMSPTTTRATTTTTTTTMLIMTMTTTTMRKATTTKGTTTTAEFKGLPGSQLNVCPALPGLLVELGRLWRRKAERRHLGHLLETLSSGPA